MMEYKGYFAKVEFDDEADIFHGEVINLRDVVMIRWPKLPDSCHSDSRSTWAAGIGVIHRFANGLLIGKPRSI